MYTHPYDASEFLVDKNGTHYRVSRFRQSVMRVNVSHGGGPSLFLSSKGKGGSGAHDHSRHKISIHSKFPRHKITPKNQQFYLSIFHVSPSTKHATRHNFQPNHSNPCKLHQDDPQHTPHKNDTSSGFWRTSNTTYPHLTLVLSPKGRAGRETAQLTRSSYYTPISRVQL